MNPIGFRFKRGGVPPVLLTHLLGFCMGKGSKRGGTPPFWCFFSRKFDTQVNLLVFLAEKEGGGTCFFSLKFDLKVNLVVVLAGKKGVKRGGTPPLPRFIGGTPQKSKHSILDPL